MSSEPAAHNNMPRSTLDIFTLRNKTPTFSPATALMYNKGSEDERILARLTPPCESLVNWKKINSEEHPSRSHSAFFVSVPRLIVPTTTVPLPGNVKALSIAGTPKGEVLSCKANSADPYITGLLTPSKPKSPNISRISISTNSKTS
uniref:Uncharacterized protein n=1 Tax=Glossina pallidipes TaxID=7398 RepID=A0A1A9ZND8_GLOPL